MRLAYSQDGEGFCRYRIEPIPAEPGDATGAGAVPAGWQLIEDANGPLVAALEAGVDGHHSDIQAAIDNTDQKWFSSDGRRLNEFAGREAVTGNDELPDMPENTSETTQYANQNMMIPLGFVASGDNVCRAAIPVSAQCRQGRFERIALEWPADALLLGQPQPCGKHGRDLAKRSPRTSHPKLRVPISESARQVGIVGSDHEGVMPARCACAV